MVSHKSYDYQLLLLLLGRECCEWYPGVPAFGGGGIGMWEPERETERQRDAIEKERQLWRA